MKQSLIIIVLLVAIIGVVYWFSSQATTDVPAAESTITTEDSAMPVATDYVGLNEAEAEALAIQNDVPFRIVERDGEMLPTTRDYRPGRINAVVEGETVVSYSIEGAEENAEPEAGNGAVTEDEQEAPADGVTESEYEAIIGLTQTEAEVYADENDVPFRIGSVDGEMRPLTMDYRPGRITASVEDGVVTSYTVE